MQFLPPVFKMLPSSKLRLFAINLGVAALYFALGKAGHFFALHPGYATVFWPPAGLALAACVHWGIRRTWLGILLGAFVANATVGEPFQASSVALVIAIGSTLQAFIGAYGLRRIEEGVELGRTAAIAPFVLLAASSCLVAPAVGNTGLLLLGVIKLDDLARSLFTGWLGEVLGVLVFLPLTMSFLSPRPLWKRRRLQVGIPLLAVAILSGLAYHIARTEEVYQLTSELSREADALLPSLIEFDESSSKPVRILATLASQPENRTAEGFARISRALRQEFRIVQSLNWIPFVRQESIRAFEAEASRQNGRTVAVTPVPGHTFQESGWMAPVMLIEPLAGNEPALGRDMLSESVRADAFQKAWKTEQVTATGRITLVQDTNGPGGVLISAVVVSEGAVVGVVTAVVNLRALLKPLFEVRNIRWHLRDRTDNTVVNATLAAPPAFAGSDHVDDRGVYLRRAFKVADRNLEILLFRPHSAFTAPVFSLATLVLVMGLMTCAGLVLFMLMVSANAEQMAIEIGERRRAEGKLRAALAEKEVLLKEIYHRVKNNLQVVSSLLNLQSRRVADAGTRQLLDDSANRVKSMALVHEQLYRTEDLSRIGLREYLQQLAGHMTEANGPLSQRVRLKLEVDEIFAGIESAIPLGLVVNELVSNAYRHGYKTDASAGEILVRLTRLPDGRICLEVKDDGCGLPANFEPSTAGSLGMQLVLTLARQLNATFSWDGGRSGASFTLQFEPEAARGRS